MKKLVIYYSYTGHTRKRAERLAAKEQADLCAVTDPKRPGTFKAYTAGSLAAMRGRPWPIRGLEADLSAYDELILMAPIWAGSPAPQFNGVVDRLPAGKSVRVYAVSASGKSSCKQKVAARIQAKGCKLTGFRDLQEG